MMQIKIICLDFDNVINDYPGWTNEGYAIVTGMPVAGVKEAIKELRDRSMLVLVHSVRCSYTGGTAAVANWLDEFGILVDGICRIKPPASVYVDDKGVTFNGDWKQTIQDIVDFIPWKNSDTAESS